MCIAVDGTKQRPGAKIKGGRKAGWRDGRGENGNKRRGEAKIRHRNATKRNDALSKMARAPVELVAELTREYWSNRARSEDVPGDVVCRAAARK